MRRAFVGAEIFDGVQRHDGAALLVEAGRVARICAAGAVPDGVERVAVEGLIAPGFVDLQVNGGGGLMLNNAPSQETVAAMAAAHGRLGTTSILPTLITDTPQVSEAAIGAVRSAMAAGTPGVIGLHLEGPHLDVARKGAHDAALIRPMEEADCAALEALAGTVESLLVTVAPASVSDGQIARLSAAGAIVSLGHSEARFEVAMTAAAAGARSVTHLFNAMSPLTSRAPGMVGAALEAGGLWAGLIADGIHVHPASIRAAMKAKRGPGRVYLVSDAMALAGSDAQTFELGGRVIRRGDGALRLGDGTLAGADLDMGRAVRFMHGEVGLEADEALRMATRYPAEVLGRGGQIGALVPGARADMVLLDGDLQVRRVWRGGAAI